jgi:hypothetical protein
MKKILRSAFACMSIATAAAQAPAGLDSIYVETYYISDANDTSVNAVGNPLPIGSVTYRIYVDMAPGYKFQGAYGVDVQPVGTVNSGDHELRISTTTQFFNNLDRGATTPTFTKNNCKSNTVMLDSWVSVGAACSGYFGVIETDDDGAATVVNTDGVLQNSDPRCGLPLTSQDGLLAGTPEAVTIVGMTSDLSVLDASINGNLISTYNGSWASLNGSMGPTSANRVLVAQITTNGSLCFQLNIQLGTPTAGGVENWVANGPVGAEATHPSLTQCFSVGIKSHENANAVSFGLYPNPVNDALTINIQEASEKNCGYKIYGVDGKVVMEKKIGTISGEFTERVDMSPFASGLYFVEVNVDGTRSTKKFIKN